MIRKFNDFINEEYSINKQDKIHISVIKDNIYIVYKDMIVKYFDFLCENNSNLEIIESSIHEPKTDYYTNEIIIEYDEESYGGYSFNKSKKAESLIESMIGENGVESYKIEEGKITIIFDQDFPMELY